MININNMSNVYNKLMCFIFSKHILLTFDILQFISAADYYNVPVLKIPVNNPPAACSLLIKSTNGIRLIFTGAHRVWRSA